MNIHRAIRAYYGEAAGEHHRYRSWGYCYGFFRQARADGLAANSDQAALQLAFYLASWGMYCGSSFLLQHAYTVHRGVIDLLADARFDALWGADFGSVIEIQKTGAHDGEDEDSHTPLGHHSVSGVG